ncbi:hypothetical protein Ahy_A03g015740 isoform A [Arachis hypogaea]|uniref:Protein FAR1-RELATED SEQUENCE n=1 Tax=Arachis hypogaea TaxID=3818 RepID=A0A445E153_ARAHY|nr:hypothetical protein Ahy_A03g015740 isoform A [Arachis hypogaea]
MDYSTPDCQVNQSEVDFETESNEVSETFCGVDDQFVSKVGLTFNTLEDDAKFYKDYSNRGKIEIKISPTEKTNPSAGLNCPARIYIHVLKDVGVWIISKVVLIWVYFADLYEDRHIWVSIYLDHHFWVRMRSTQRSESMHCFFNKFITQNSSLIQFVKQYDNCLGSREQTERESDAAYFHIAIPCATKSSIKAQF